MLLCSHARAAQKAGIFREVAAVEAEGGSLRMSTSHSTFRILRLNGLIANVFVKLGDDGSAFVRMRTDGLCARVCMPDIRLVGACVCACACVRVCRCRRRRSYCPTSSTPLCSSSSIPSESARRYFGEHARLSVADLAPDRSSLRCSVLIVRVGVGCNVRAQILKVNQNLNECEPFQKQALSSFTMSSFAPIQQSGVMPNTGMNIGNVAPSEGVAVVYGRPPYWGGYNPYYRPVVRPIHVGPTNVVRPPRTFCECRSTSPQARGFSVRCANDSVSCAMCTCTLRVCVQSEWTKTTMTMMTTTMMMTTKRKWSTAALRRNASAHPLSCRLSRSLSKRRMGSGT
jgi:hypothetical protein